MALFIILITVLITSFNPTTASEQTSQPNIVFILTDDQDVVLGGLEPMVKTKRLIGDRGIRFDNMFVNTPLCCPSRSSILTGQHLHNTRVYNNSIPGNCNSRWWQTNKEHTEAFAPHIKSQGYQTFFAGKYLNQYGNGHMGGVKHIPTGWDDWNGLVGNSVYYDYTLSRNGKAERHAHNYTEDYLTDLIWRRASDFIDNSQQTKPLFLMLSTPSAHAPFTPAPQYKDRFSDRKAPRTPSFNTHAADKHWLIRQPRHPMAQISVDYSDYAFRNRYRSLLSVDDLVENLIEKLEAKGILNNSYIVFSSDNGFHMGQFSMPIDKRQLYEFDIRVPMMIRGPGIHPGQVSTFPVMNIDLAPTFLALAGMEPISSMDGRSLLPILQSSVDSDDPMDTSVRFTASPPPPLVWRSSMLIEHDGEAHSYDKWCPSKSNQGVAICFPDCVCQDAGNNTYSCIRALYADKNYIYCEIRDQENFREFYDLRADPHQLVNVYDKVPEILVEKLHRLLNEMNKCTGRECRRLEMVRVDELNADLNDDRNDNI